MPIVRRRDAESENVSDPVAREHSLVLSLGGHCLCRLQCSPTQLEELALGFLLTMGLLPPNAVEMPIRTTKEKRETFVDVAIDVTDADVERFREGLTAGTGCGMGVFSVKGFDPLDCGRKIDMSFRIDAAELADAVRAFQKESGAYRDTGGVHSAGVAAGGQLLAFAEDVGRHNAIDKVIGCCIRAGIPMQDKLLLSTGRLSLDVAAKAIRAGAPLLASRSAPTDAAVDLARLANLTLVGFVRGTRMNIYCADWRIE